MNEKMMELLDHMELREKAMTFDNPKERLASSLHEFEEDDIAPFVSASIMAAVCCGGPEPMAQLISMLTIGLEMGRELERRAA